jgi:hypothetical protein
MSQYERPPAATKVDITMAIEVFYYKDVKNNLRISYRSCNLEDDEQDE